MTGITTTPHLHFQIDRESAPSHPYWPYSFKDIQDAGIDFFAAVNLGLGKENALKNTVHPMEFVRDNASFVAASAVSVPKEAVVAAANPTPVSAIPSVTEESAPKNSAPPESETSKVATPVPDVPAIAPTVKPELSDVSKNSVLFPAVRFALEAGMFELDDAGRFLASAPVSRREAVAAFAKLASVPSSASADLPFSDVLPSDPVSGVLARFVELGYVASVEKFRPNDTITRAEAAILLTRISKFAPISGRSAFSDMKPTDSRAATLNAFAAALRMRKNIRFGLETPLSRGEFAKMVHTWKTKTGRP